MAEKKYTTEGLGLAINDRNPWMVATKQYSECIGNFFFLFRTRNDFEKELQRSDINSVCKQELDTLKSLSSEIRYKEVLSYQHEVVKHHFYEEILVDNKP